MNPDAIERHDWPEDRERRRSGWPAQTVIEYVNDRSARQPIVEIAKDHKQAVPHRIEILQNLSYLKPSLA
jgi:hypothetical protein